jgi:ABC-2 type transport system permease protein
MAEFVRAVWLIAYREILRFAQDRSRAVSSFAMPVLFLLIFGAGFNGVMGSLTPGIDFIKFMYPGIIAMGVLQNSLFSGLSIVWDREFGFLREVLVAPLSRSGIVVGKMVGGASLAMLQALIMLVLAPFVGASLSLVLVVKLLPMLALLSFCLSGVGILIAARMRSQQGFQVLMQIFVLPMMFTSGVFFPLSSVPLWLEVVSKVNPMSYGVDAIRQLFLSGIHPPTTGASTGGRSVSLHLDVLGHTMTTPQDLAVVAALGLTFLLASTWAFSRED